MDNERVNRLGDLLLVKCEEFTGVDISLNFGIAQNALWDAIDELGEDADDSRIVARAFALFVESR